MRIMSHFHNPIMPLTQQLADYFAARTDHRVPLVDFLRQHVDSPNEMVSDDIDTYLKNGLKVEIARCMYEQQGPNEVTSPQNCPPILCCLLPCLNNTPKMKAYNNNRSDTATVTRFYSTGGGLAKRFLMDSVSLVVGDVITVYDGDLVPADCRIVRVLNDPMEVDVAVLFGSIGKRQRPMTRTCVGEDSERQGGSTTTDSVLEAENVLLTGSRVLSGAALCVVTATGDSTVWSTMVRTQTWPPR